MSIEEELKELNFQELMGLDWTRDTGDVAIVVAYVRSKLRELGEDIKKTGWKKRGHYYWGYDGNDAMVDGVVEKACGEETPSA